MATIGLRNLVYAKLVKDDNTGVTYDTVKPIAPAIDAKISPSTNTDSLYADDGIVETVETLGEISVELEVSDLPVEVLADLQGHTIDNNGALVKKATDQAPYVAIGFKSKKSNGKYKYVWLYKGKFSLIEEEYHTNEDKANFSTPKLKGTFLKRIYDEAWQVSADEDTTGFTQALADKWFDSVYEENATLA
ncbi:major tail protein [Tepidibacter thalassicus]|uniref:Phage major tail protein, phi13 family n=1 Tax=Tepidibacter thalassicus DSM 15285 TaxID=1123350 RepID=A0A1M5PW05_9FIRM|nr:major tail protein [Tepidibacter thalassicus]SHH05882.1 phage major tail protein, phi13 family [Tepidibacter thalassicus DSM 15285]